MNTQLSMMQTREMDSSPLSDHLRTVEKLIASGDYDVAVAEMNAAVERFKRYTDDITATIDKSIAHLSSKDGQYNAPVPQALSLLRLKNSLFTKDKAPNKSS